jgi:hypothetical protein
MTDAFDPAEIADAVKIRVGASRRCARVLACYQLQGNIGKTTFRSTITPRPGLSESFRPGRRFMC